MMGKHTPGPWKLADHKWRLVVSKPGDGFITREVCRMDASTMATFEQHANAALIASAPDLLAALEDADNRLCDLGDTPKHPTRVAINAAIKKARGE